MALDTLISALGDEILDADEEAFMLFAQDIPSSNLGFVDRQAATLDVVFGGREFTIHQSPTVLNSSREGGTTGAVLWKITPLFTAWLSSPDNILTTSRILTPASSVVELGCGISALTALSLRGLVASYILTDQPYVARLVAQNLASNEAAPALRKDRRGKRTTTTTTTTVVNTDVRFAPLDWERDDAASVVPRAGADLVIACDCVYNDALVGPLVDTLADVCRVREAVLGAGTGEEDVERTVCVVAQQLRHADVFGAWMGAFLEKFRAWRVPGERLPEGLRPKDGFVVHVGVLREVGHGGGWLIWG